MKSLNFEKTYIGQTEDLDRRLLDSGKSNYTAKFVPWKIVYTEKFCPRDEVLKRENILKALLEEKVLKNY